MLPAAAAAVRECTLLGERSVPQLPRSWFGAAGRSRRRRRWRAGAKVVAAAAAAAAAPAAAAAAVVASGGLTSFVGVSLVPQAHIVVARGVTAQWQRQRWSFRGEG